jgi:signal transduction histidine kinase
MRWRRIVPRAMDTILPPHDADRSAAEGQLQREQHAPAFRRWSACVGLQGKLIFAMMYVLILAIGASCWLFGSQSSARISEIMGEQARQISYALSLAAKSSFEQRNQAELSVIGQDLIKTRNVLFVAFVTRDGQQLAAANRDPSFQWNDLDSLRLTTSGLMQIHQQRSAVLGDYLAVMSPVLGVSSPGAVGLSNFSPEGGSHLLGYVVVGLSQTREQAMLRQINYLVMVIGGSVILLSLPLSYSIVRRIFLPIRQLVTATDQIAAGNLETQVAIHRPDVIGTLARSFNEMVLKVRAQQTALAQANSDLECKVLERTAQLEIANKRLSSEIAEKEDFLRAISHDLNAPLRNIAGMASMLLLKNREQFDEDIIHRLERIQKNVQVETDLISELLELSRIKTRRQQIEPVEIDAMVRDLGEVFENDLKSRDIALIVDQHLPVLNCEKARMRQVFQNLIDNAIKYMGSGSVREIHVGGRVKGSEAEFYVSDTGIGIEPEDLGKIFFVFRRGKSQAVQSVCGKGVGLASVKSIVETYSGTIWVESQPGKGSTFRFTVNGMYLMQPSEASAVAA